MKLPKLLIIGAGSRLGFRLMEKAQGRFDWTGVDAFPSHPEIILADITRPDNISSLIDARRPDFVIHTAAVTDVDGCERNRALARSVNVNGSMNIAESCQKFKSRLRYISTDYVFDGSGGPYDESAVPQPINYYGQTKLDGEQCVQSICPDALTVRTCVPYDWNPKCPPNFLMWLVQKLKANENVSIVNDQWNTPTYNPHLAEVLLALCGRWIPGILHASGGQFINRYDFALTVCDIFGFDRNRVTQTNSSQLKQLATRPMRAGLRVDKIESHLGVKMISVADGLEKAYRAFKA